MTTNEHLERLTDLFLYEGLNAREQHELKELLKVSENKDYFKKAYILWHSSQHAGDQDYVEKALQRALFRFDDRQKQQRRRIGLPEWRYTFRKMAAAVLIAFTLGAVSYHFVFSGGHPVSSAGDPLTSSKVIVPLGSRSQVELPDGTLVTLNAGSNIHYQSSYGQATREVWLEGEGYFNVVKNTAIPFVVKAKDVTIKALGTEFNVKAYPEEEIVQTTLVNGLVTVTQTNTSDQPKEITLKPKETVTIYDQKATVSAAKRDLAQPIASQPPVQTVNKVTTENVELKKDINTELYTSWKDPRWVIESEPLSELALKLQRRYDVRIIIADDALQQYPINGILTDETLEQVLEIMKSIAPINYSLNKKTVTLNVNTRHKKYFDEMMR